VTTIIGLAVVIFALKPPELLIMLNLFAFGGLESAFLWSVVFGLYWKKANKYGAISSMVVGLILYIFISELAPNIYGMHSVTLPIVASFVTFIVVSLIAQKVKKIEDYHF
jgi:sodium/pantothenate symporter